MPARIEHVAAGIIERHGQAEGLAFLDLGYALLDLLSLVSSFIRPSWSSGP